MKEQAVAVREQTAIEGELSVAQVMAQVQKIQELIRAGMKENEHFGVIPGTERHCQDCNGTGKEENGSCFKCRGLGKITKPTLYKPGAEKLCLMFRLAPDYESTERQDGDHLTIKSKCTLSHIPTGRRLGSGEGSCSTREVKYAYRHGSRKCPTCGKEAIIKGKREYGGGWLCFKKKDGCGAKFKEGDAAIESQQVGRIPNDDLADQYNTVLKMANKRSLIAAVLNVTAASDIFTQDLEDLDDAPAAAPTRDKEVPQPSPHDDDVSPPAAAGAVPSWREQFLVNIIGLRDDRDPKGLVLKSTLSALGYVKVEDVPQDKAEAFTAEYLKRTGKG